MKVNLVVGRLKMPATVPEREVPCSQCNRTTLVVEELAARYDGVRILCTSCFVGEVCPTSRDDTREFVPLPPPV